MLAAAQADMDTLHQLLIADPTLVNRKDFIQVSVWGYYSELPAHLVSVYA